MKNNYAIKTIFIFIFAILFVYIGFKSINYLQGQIAQEELQNSHKRMEMQMALTIKPDLPPGVDSVIKIELVVQDDIEDIDGEVEYVEFNHYPIPLEVSDPMEDRGRVYFQIQPGKYELVWKVKSRSGMWPHTKTIKKIITLEKYQKFVHIQISGKNLNVSWS